MSDDIYLAYNEYESMCSFENSYTDTENPGNPDSYPELPPGSELNKNGVGNIIPGVFPGQMPIKPLAGFQIVPIELNELLRKKLPPRKLMLSPWLPENGLAMIFASRGVGKTFFALEIAVALATGTEFLGWKAERPYRVMYLDGEMCASDLQERLKKICGSTSLVEDGQFVLVTPEIQPGACPDLTSLLWQQSLETHLQNIDLIVVDNISTLCRTGAENEAESWAPVQEWAIKQRSSGRSVLFIHHAGKSGAQRGTSKREDIMEQ